MITRFVTFFILLLCTLQTTQATLYTRMADEDLLDQSTLVVAGVVSDRYCTDIDGRIETHFTISVEKTLKGDHEPEITVTVPGGVGQDDRALVVFGAPDFSIDDVVILFLDQRPQGSYAIEQFFLGAFQVVERDGQTVAVRDLTKAIELPPAPQQTLHEQVDEWTHHREASRFKQWIASKTANADTAISYWVPQKSEAPITAKYSLFGSRWPEFDEGQSVAWTAHANGQSGMTGGGFTKFQEALACWNDDSGSNISYTYTGTSTATSGLQRPDGINSILFDDPNNEIGGSYNCRSGGTLGMGGFYASINHTYKGQSFSTIIEGNIVTQDGAGCYFETNDGANGAEVFAHELGHTLGLQHSDDPNALMYPTAHGDGRGAALSGDDQDAVRYLYESSEPSDLNVPTGLSASDGTHKDRVAISWNAVTAADTYQLYRSTTDSDAGSRIYSGAGTHYNDTDAEPGVTYFYRVRACNGQGCSSLSNQDSGYKLEEPGPEIPKAPTNLKLNEG